MGDTRHQVASHVRRWLALGLAAVGWVLVAMDPVVGGEEIVGPSAAAWQTLAAASVIASLVATLRPTLTSVAVAGGLPVAIGLWRGFLYLDLGAYSPLGVWMLVTALSVEVTWSRLDDLDEP